MRWLERYGASNGNNVSGAASNSNYTSDTVPPSAAEFREATRQAQALSSGSSGSAASAASPDSVRQSVVDKLLDLADAGSYAASTDTSAPP